MKTALLIHAKINTGFETLACDTYYFLIIFLILALLLAGELSTLILSFNSPTKAPIGSGFGSNFGSFLIGQNRKSLITRHPVIVER